MQNIGWAIWGHPEDSLAIARSLRADFGFLAVTPCQDHIRIPSVVFAPSRRASAVCPLGILLLCSLGVLGGASNIPGYLEGSHNQKLFLGEFLYKGACLTGRRRHWLRSSKVRRCCSFYGDPLGEPGGCGQKGVQEQCAVS